MTSSTLVTGRKPEWVLTAPEYVLYTSIFDKAMNQEWPRHFDE